MKDSNDEMTGEVHSMPLEQFLEEFTRVGTSDEYLEQCRREADANTEPWQRAIAPGDLVLVQVGPDEFHWARILDAVELVRSTGASEERVREVAELYSAPGTARLANFFTAEQPDGELEVEDFHVASVVGVLDPGVFQLARSAGWPTSVQAIVQVVKRTAWRAPGPM